jgi:hypothetical protein
MLASEIGMPLSPVAVPKMVADSWVAKSRRSGLPARMPPPVTLVPLPLLVLPAEILPYAVCVLIVDSRLLIWLTKTFTAFARLEPSSVTLMVERWAVEESEALMPLGMVSVTPDITVIVLVALVIATPSTVSAASCAAVPVPAAAEAVCESAIGVEGSASSVRVKLEAAPVALLTISSRGLPLGSRTTARMPEVADPALMAAATSAKPAPLPTVNFVVDPLSEVRVKEPPALKALLSLRITAALVADWVTLTETVACVAVLDALTVKAEFDEVLVSWVQVEPVRKLSAEVERPATVALMDCIAATCDWTAARCDLTSVSG